MRLLNAETLRLEEFFTDVPKYAILSHTWGADEVTFQRLTQPNVNAMRGFAKIQYTCTEALKAGLKYTWVDTCCIDKTNSSELAEAINSMFRWYEEATVCYAYMADVSSPDQSPFGLGFHLSKWFTRGWTLQELLAPPKLLFFTSDWTFIDSRDSLAPDIMRITGIQQKYLKDPASDAALDTRRSLLLRASVAERMSWASLRQTTRREDRAYSLLGLFGVNMPLLYGEGENAFQRLQEEIIRSCFDPSLLAWDVRVGNRTRVRITIWQPPLIRMAQEMMLGRLHPWRMLNPKGEEDLETLGVLAPGPENFQHCHDIITDDAHFEWALTSMGLKVTLPISEGDPFLILPCRRRNHPNELFALSLKRSTQGRYRRRAISLRLLGYSTWWMWQRRELVLSVKTDSEPVVEQISESGLWVRSAHLRFLHAYTAMDWLLVSGYTNYHSSEQSLDDQEIKAILLFEHPEIGQLVLVVQENHNARMIKKAAGLLALQYSGLEDTLMKLRASPQLQKNVYVDKSRCLQLSTSFKKELSGRLVFIVDIAERKTTPPGKVKLTGILLWKGAQGVKQSLERHRKKVYLPFTPFDTAIFTTLIISTTIFIAIEWVLFRSDCRDPMYLGQYVQRYALRFLHYYAINMQYAVPMATWFYCAIPLLSYIMPETSDFWRRTRLPLSLCLWLLITYSRPFPDFANYYIKYFSIAHLFFLWFPAGLNEWLVLHTNDAIPTLMIHHGVVLILLYTGTNLPDC